MLKAAILAVLLSLTISSVPLPFSEEGTATVAAGSTWSYHFDLVDRAHVTCIIRSDQPVDMALSGNDTVVIDGANGTHRYQATIELPQGGYQIVLRNTGNASIGVSYQVHVDYIVFGNMTAKDLMALALAFAIVVVALALYGRRGRP